MEDIKKIFCPTLKEPRDIDLISKEEFNKTILDNTECYEGLKEEILDNLPIDILWILKYKDNWVYGHEIDPGFIKITIHNSHSWIFPAMKMYYLTLCNDNLIFSNTKEGFNYINISISLISGRIENIISNHLNSGHSFHIYQDKVYIATYECIYGIILQICDSHLNILETINIIEKSTDRRYMRDALLIGFHMVESTIYFHLELDHCGGHDFIVKYDNYVAEISDSIGFFIEGNTYITEYKNIVYYNCSGYVMMIDGQFRDCILNENAVKKFNGKNQFNTFGPYIVSNMGYKKVNIYDIRNDIYLTKPIKLEVCAVGGWAAALVINCCATDENNQLYIVDRSTNKLLKITKGSKIDDNQSDALEEESLFDNILPEVYFSDSE